MPRFRIRRVEDDALCQAMHTLLFPHDDWEDADAYWVAFDERGGPAAFASARRLATEDGVFFTRAGVMPYARGAGLQRRLTHARLRWCREIGAQYALTYVLYDNHPSLMNLLRCGFRLYHPAHRWAGNVNYLWRSL